MKKVLGLVISHRKPGNCEILVKEIMRSIPEECHCEIIRLTDMKIEPCRACYHCLQPGNECKIPDDFNFILNKINQADALIIGVPIYLLGPHGYYKMLSDRMVSCAKYASLTAGKPCILVVPYGIKGWEGYTRPAALVMPRLLQMKIIDYWPVEAALPGESLFKTVNLEYARSLGSRLFNDGAYKPGARECPHCGSDLFRLLPGDRIECPICSAQGILQQNSIPHWPDSGQYRFSAANIEAHFTGWLTEMKEKFHLEKHRLKAVQNAYRDKDWFIKP